MEIIARCVDDVTGLDAGRSEQAMLDIGVILQAPMQDKDWLKKCALMGLMSFALMLIPLVGAILSSLNLMGWMRTYAEGRMRGETEIPPVNLGYLGAGWKIFLMYLPVVGLMIAGLVVVTILTFVSAKLEMPTLGGIISVVATFAIIPVVLWLVVFNSAILYLHIVKGEPWASMRLGQQWDLAKRTGTTFLLLWVAFLVAGIIGELGMVACGIGIIVSFPYMYLMQGSAIAEFARVTNNA